MKTLSILLLLVIASGCALTKRTSSHNRQSQHVAAVDTSSRKITASQTAIDTTKATAITQTTDGGTITTIINTQTVTDYTTNANGQQVPVKTTQTTRQQITEKKARQSTAINTIDKGQAATAYIDSTLQMGKSSTADIVIDNKTKQSRRISFEFVGLAIVFVGAALFAFKDKIKLSTLIAKIWNR